MDANGAEWMTVAEIAVRFGVTVDTVRGWVRRGLLPVEQWRPRHDHRTVLGGIRWVVRSGASWRAMPEVLPEPDAQVSL